MAASSWLAVTGLVERRRSSPRTLRASSNRRSWSSASIIVLSARTRIGRVAPTASTAARRDVTAALVAGRPLGPTDVDQRRGVRAGILGRQPGQVKVAGQLLLDDHALLDVAGVQDAQDLDRFAVQEVAVDPVG